MKRLKRAGGGYTPDAQGLYNVTLANGVTASLDQQGLGEFLGRGESVLGNTSDVLGSDPSTQMDKKNALADQWAGGGKEAWYGGTWKPPANVVQPPNPSAPAPAPGAPQAPTAPGGAQAQTVPGQPVNQPFWGGQQSPFDWDYGWGGGYQSPGLATYGAQDRQYGGGQGFYPATPSYPLSSMAGSPSWDPYINSLPSDEGNPFNTANNYGPQRGGFAFKSGGRARQLRA